MSDRKNMTAGWREICALAPPCSEDAEGMNARCTHRRDQDMQWRDVLRKAQGIARAALHEAGLKEEQ